MPQRFGPPITDSDDSEDELFGNFSFADDWSPTTGKRRRYMPKFIKPIDPEQDLYDAVVDGKLTDMLEIIKKIEFDINKSLISETTLLHTACRYTQLAIVNYLLQNGADVNCQIDSVTPLMEACACRSFEKMNKQFISKIVLKLIEHGALINETNKYGMTPFMLACQYGHLDVVKILIKDVSLEASNNEDKTVIYHAIENNHIELVKFLIKSGINVETFDGKGYTPSQVAQNFGFHDIYELLPKPKIEYTVPQEFLHYSSVHDYVPQIFPKTEIPDYFQEIYKILCDINMGKFIEYFALAGINLTEFLTISDKRLEEIGIKYPFQRNKIRMGLIHFHLNHWSKRDITQVKRNNPDNFYDILMLTANQLQHLTTINSTLIFVQQYLDAEQLGDINWNHFKKLRSYLNKYKDTLSDFKDTVKYLNSFGPIKPPLYIDYNQSKKKPWKVKRYLKYTILLGISIAVCINVRRICIHN